MYSKLAVRQINKSVRLFSGAASLEGYGKHLFKGAVAAPYLEAAGLPKGTLDNGDWTRDGATADKVANAVSAWARDNGASVYCHWFQPLAASGVRHGGTGQVQNHFFEFDKDGVAQWDFKGKHILKGETDGSSYPNGGLRATHTAGGYLSVDPTSPIFLRGDTIFIPASFVNYHGQALDEKTPLLRSCDALSRESKRLMGHLGFNIEGVSPSIGLEQEIFFVPRDAYMKRPDLQMTGRTVMGRLGVRGQEMCDHYMAPPSLASPALACMQEIQEQCFAMGIPLRTRHREVAPNQYEFAPLFGFVTTQIDQNVTVMQVIEEVAVRYGLAALLQEKPFDQVNGSGKHNNWSLFTDCGTNLFNVSQLNKNSGNPAAFPTVMSAICKAVLENGDLMRMAIASPGNDFRLGACEAPPAIMSVYLGDDMTKYLDAFKNGESKEYSPTTKMLSTGVKALADVEVPAEDRNRTSPFPYGGHRFEFRAVGSAQNVSLVNTVLNTITAKAFADFSDAIEKGAKPDQVAREALQASWKVVFNGNGYDEANQEKLTKDGLWRIDSGVESIARFTADKNVKLFEQMKIFTPEECAARQTILIDHYVGSVEMEVLCMIDMINQHVIPSAKEAGITGYDLEGIVATLKKDLAAAHAESDEVKRGDMFRTLRLETMVTCREKVDELEGIVPAELWTLATYKELMFLDQHHVDGY